MLFRVVCFWFFYLMLTACNRIENPYKNNLGIEPSLLAQMDTANYTVIQWKNVQKDFGIIKANDSVHLQYQFTNIGLTPLFILNTRTSCGCTITNFPKDPVMPGKSGMINVTYKSGSQNGEIRKTITVISNTKKAMTSTLIIHGVVQFGNKIQ